MDEQNVQPDRPETPERKKLSKMRIFKEVYLPVIIAGVAALLIIIFITGSITRAVQRHQLNKEVSAAVAESLAAERARLDEEAATLLQQAAQYADGYDYLGAVEILDSFSGDATQYPELTARRDEYLQLSDTMVAWEDPNQVVNLSFQLLIVDPERAFANAEYSNSFYNSFITTAEFSAILQQLYDNDYILVRMEDFISVHTAEDGSTIYNPKTLYLPSGKKPLMLTQTNVNYNLYLVDSDGDMYADQGGSGFASKLLMDGNGFTCEYVDAEGQTLTGAYDLVPILDAFVAQHPDFSFRGAKATLALTGYNGLFGHRTHSAAREKLGEEAYTRAAQQASTLAKALTENGYTLACYTYSNTGYGDRSTNEIKVDLSNWNAEVVPILGGTNMLVYAQKSDINPGSGYSGEKYEMLRDSGFNYYLGFCNDGKPWAEFGIDYVRQGRILVTGEALENNADWFTGMFDAASVLDAARTPTPTEDEQ